MLAPPAHRALTAAAIAGPLVLLAVAGYVNFRQVESQAVRAVEASTRAVAEHAHRTFRAQRMAIDFLDHHVTGMSWAEIVRSRPLHDTLRQLVAASPDLASIFLLDPSGQRWLSSRSFPMQEIDGSDREYFVALKAGGQSFHVSGPLVGRLAQDRFFSLAKRRTSPAGAFDGLIAVSANPAYFERFYESLGSEAGDALLLVREDGVTLARYPEATDSGAVPLPLTAYVSGTGAVPSAHWVQEKLVASMRVGDLPVHALVERPGAVLWAEWQRITLPTILACGLMSALLLVGLSNRSQRARRVAAQSGERVAVEESRAKDAFIAALGHELRNPLAAISNAALALSRRPASAPAMVPIIERQVTHLRSILDDLFDTARALHGKLHLVLKPVDLQAVVDAALADRWRAPLPRPVTSTRGAPPWVEADPVRVKQILDNLLDNALKYGGRDIRIELDAGPLWVRLTVADDGQGIAADLLPQLFEPFVQGEQGLDRRAGGLGLGLALAHRLAALQGGTLEAASPGPGKGSRFTLSLRRIEPPYQASAEAVRAEADDSLDLLVVEDDPDARASLVALLEADRHVVTAVGDAEAALEAIGRHRFNAALIDIGLPGRDGHALARELRARGHTLRLAAVSGYGGETEQRSRAAGFDVHLTKPVDPALLRAFLDGAAAEVALAGAAR